MIEVGTRPLAMAQWVLHQVAQCLAPACLPLFLTDGYKAYATALLTHCGPWVQPPRRQDKGPHPKPALDAAARAAVCAGDQNDPQAPVTSTIKWQILRHILAVPSTSFLAISHHAWRRFRA